MANNPGALGTLVDTFHRNTDPDDTLSLQRAIDWSIEFGMPVYGTPNAIYDVSFATSQTGVHTALIADSNMQLIGRGATIRMANAQDHCSVMQVNDFGGSTPISNMNFSDWIIDGNCQNQTITPSGIFSPTLYMNNVTGSRFLQLRIKNAIFIGFYASGASAAAMVDNEIDDMYIDTCIGSGINTIGQRWRMGRIFVKDVAYNDSNSEGNPFISSITDSTIDAIYAKNFGYGVKFQAGASRITVGKITALGGANNALVNERGVKFQGSGGSGQLFDISVGSIIAQDIPTTGLYFTDAHRIAIGSYSGARNSFYNAVSQNDRCDIGFFNGSDAEIGNVFVEDFSYLALRMTSAMARLKIGRMSARTTSTTIESGWAYNILTGRLDIGVLEAKNSGAARPIGITSFPAGGTNPNNCVRVGRLDADIDTTLYYKVSPVSLFQGGAGDQHQIMDFALKGFVNNIPTLPLTANSTTTQVTGQSAFTYNGGDFGCYIKCIPADTNAVTLAAGMAEFPVSPIQMDVSGGGFVITHPSSPTPGNVAIYIDRYVASFGGPEV